MQKTAKLSSGALALKIEDFGTMQARYSALPLPSRASAVLADAQPALAVASKILQTLAAAPQSAKAVANMRSNLLLLGKIRASEAKTALMDPDVDFIKTTNQKPAAWSKAIGRIASGQDKATPLQENIPEHLAFTMVGIASVSNYLSMIKLIIPELIKLDPAHEQEYSSMLVEIRRCGTVLSDCECASGLNSVVLH